MSVAGRFAVRAQPLAKTHHTELPRMPLALSPCGCRTDLAQLTPARSSEAMWRRLLRGRHILDRSAAWKMPKYSETLAMVENAGFQRNSRGLRGRAVGG
jgi:hypothetical protein